MNSKLRVWLQALSVSDRARIVPLLGDLAAESEDDKVENALRAGAGLPPRDVDPAADATTAAARKAAGLPADKPPSVDSMRKAAGLE